MRSTRKASFYLFTAAFILVPAAAMTACGDDDTGGGGGVVLLDGSAGDAKTFPQTDANGKTDAPVTPTDSGNDVNQPNNEAGADSGSDAGADADASSNNDADAGDSGTDSGTDADADAGPAKPTSLDNATYKITAWTCNGTKDVLAFASTAGIGEIDLTVAATSKLDVLFSGGDCDRSNAVVVTYPEDGKVTTTSNAADTCSGTCSQSQCDPLKVEPVLVDTYDYTKTSTTFTATRSFPSGRDNTLAGLATCAQGDTESVTYTKKP